MDRHVRILGLLNMVFGIGGLAFAILVLIVFGGFRGLFASFEGSMLAVISVMLISFQLVISIPCAIAGSLVMRYNEVGRVILIICSALNILNFPVGSALGGYGLWVLLEAETDPLFRDNPVLQAKEQDRQARVAAAVARKAAAATAASEAVSTDSVKPKNSKNILSLGSQGPTQ
jgi:hypothetical protein